MSEQVIPSEHIGDRLWNKAVEEAGPENLSMLMAYQAGKADAARDILRANERDSHDTALDILNESRQFLGIDDE